MDILAAIHQRFSVRSYADRTVEPPLLERLLSVAENTEPVSEAPPRVALVNGVDAVRQILTFIVGSYGLVQNVPHLLVGILPKESESARVDLGYVLENVVLEATRLGLGSCWITGTYDSKNAGDAVTLRSGEVAAAVCALGYPTEAGLGRLHTQLIRRLAGGHQRKPLSKLVFSEQWKEAWSPDDVDPKLITVLKHARLAPSARNAQPWRFILKSNRVTLAMVKPMFIDAGIVMSHIALAAAAVEHKGTWKLRLRDDALAEACNLPQSTVPIATFRFSDG